MPDRRLPDPAILPADFAHSTPCFGLCGRGTRINQEVTANPHLVPDSYTRWGPISFMPPEGLLHVGTALTDRGYPAPAIAAILGGNFRRIADQAWRQPS